MATTTGDLEGRDGIRRGLLRSLLESEEMSVFEAADLAIERIAEDLEDSGWTVTKEPGSFAAAMGKLRMIR